MKEKYIIADPSASSLVESLRDIGYSMETAVADVIDNSLTANASVVDIRFSWNDGEPWLAIIDNGHGMSVDELTNAMRLGSRNPLLSREADDLGRFGLGLKTASFSQCRLLTVLTQKDGTLDGQEWDLDYIANNPEAGWQIRVVNTETLNGRPLERALIQEFLPDSDGTVVLWRLLDRFDGTESKLNALVDVTRKHLELTFHRFISPDPGKKQVKMTINGDQLVSFNPFNHRNVATQELPSQTIIFQDQKINVRPYVLPHHNKVTRQEYEKYAGDGGYLMNQGFYVYRNRRLIIQGTWFRLHKKEELTKLVRVQVDIPNTLDHLWKINVNKSHAFPPEAVRKELKIIIEKISGSGKRVYKQRGAKINRISVPAWSRYVAGGIIYYRINRDHPFLNELHDSIPETNKLLLDNVLSILENGFPVDLFFNDMANNPEKMNKPVVDTDQLILLVNSLIAILQQAGIDRDRMVDNLLSTDPLASNRDATIEILREKGLLH